MFKKILLFLVVLLLVAAAYLQFGHLPEPLPADTQSSQWLEKGIHDVSYFQRSRTVTTPAAMSVAFKLAFGIRKTWSPQRHCLSTVMALCLLAVAEVIWLSILPATVISSLLWITP